MNERSILVVAHAGRVDTVEAARRVIDALRDADARPVLAADDHEALVAVDPFFAETEVLGVSVDPSDLELAIVLGGDGTILRAAELVRDSGAPVLGINMGHVGFLAEIDRDDMDKAVRRVIDRDYEVEERLALSVRVKDADGTVVYETWALNEATVEKASRERMIEVVLEIDGRPLSSFGCDGMVVSTPTGSTAYNFSAGARSSGPASRRSPWCRCPPTLCSPSRSSSAPMPPSRSRCSSAPTARAFCGATAGARTICRRALASWCVGRRVR